MSSSPDTAPLCCTIARDGGRLLWEITNVSAAPVWAFLFVPSVTEQGWGFAKDSAWFAREGAFVIARKVDAEPPSDRHVDLVSSGAVELAPGERRAGSIVIDDEVKCGEPYGDVERVRPHQLVLEVGWLPVRAGQPAEHLRFDGSPFAYLRTLTEPGGQRFVRSPPLPW